MMRERDCSGGASDHDLGRPVPGQKHVDALGGMVRQSPEDVGEPRVGIDVVELDEVDGLRSRHHSAKRSRRSLIKEAIHGRYYDGRA